MGACDVGNAAVGVLVPPAIAVVTGLYAVEFAEVAVEAGMSDMCDVEIGVVVAAGAVTERALTARASVAHSSALQLAC